MIRAATLLANGLPGENTMLTYRAAIGPAACLGLAFAQAAFADTTVSGTVTNAETGAVIVNARVDVYGVDDNWDFIASVHSDANGRYTWTGDCDDSGPCHLFFSQTGYVVAEASFDPATASSVVNASLHQWPTVSGYVRLADGSPAADVDVRLAAPQVLDTTTDANGFYSLTFSPGTYGFCAGGTQWGLVQQCFDHIDQVPPANAPQFSPVIVHYGDQIHADFDLGAGGSLSGTLHESYSGGPLANLYATVQLTDVNRGSLDSATVPTDAAGHYRVSGIPTGVYFVTVTAPTYLFSDAVQRYPGIDCTNGCDADAGDPITIADGEDVQAIDLTFQPDAVIHGRITDSSSAAPLADVSVDVYVPGVFGIPQLAGTSPPSAADGSYWMIVESTTDGIAYQAVTTRGAPHIDVAYPNVPCIIPDDCVTDGLAIPTTLGAAIEADFQLPLGASLSGSVRDAMNDMPVQAFVDIFDAEGHFIWTGHTDANGDYEAAAWTEGTFFVRAYADGMIPVCQVYADHTCPADASPPNATDATPVPLQTGQVLDGIDFRLNLERIFNDGFDPN